MYKFLNDAGTSIFAWFEYQALGPSKVQPTTKYLIGESIAQNDIKLLYKINIKLLGEVFDSKLAHYLINPDINHDIISLIIV